jgi:hypothetical protein
MIAVLVIGAFRALGQGRFPVGRMVTGENFDPNQSLTPRAFAEPDFVS